MYNGGRKSFFGGMRRKFIYVSVIVALSVPRTIAKVPFVADSSLTRTSFSIDHPMMESSTDSIVTGDMGTSSVASLTAVVRIGYPSHHDPFFQTWILGEHTTAFSGILTNKEGRDIFRIPKLPTDGELMTSLGLLSDVIVVILPASEEKKVEWWDEVIKTLQTMVIQNEFRHRRMGSYELKCRLVIVSEAAEDDMWVTEIIQNRLEPIMLPAYWETLEIMTPETFRIQWEGKNLVGESQILNELLPFENNLEATSVLISQVYQTVRQNNEETVGLDSSQIDGSFFQWERIVPTNQQNHVSSDKLENPAFVPLTQANEDDSNHEQTDPPDHVQNLLSETQRKAYNLENQIPAYSDIENPAFVPLTRPNDDDEDRNEDVKTDPDGPMQNVLSEATRRAYDSDDENEPNPASSDKAENPTIVPPSIANNHNDNEDFKMDPQDRVQNVLSEAQRKLYDLENQMQEVILESQSMNRMPMLDFGDRLNAILVGAYNQLSEYPPSVRHGFLSRLVTKAHDLYMDQVQAFRDYYGRRYEVCLDQETDQSVWTVEAEHLTEGFRAAAINSIPHLCRPPEGELSRLHSFDFTILLQGLVHDMMAATELRIDERSLAFDEDSIEDESSPRRRFPPWVKKVASRILALGINYIQGWLAWQGVKRAALERDREMPKFPLF